MPCCPFSLIQSRGFTLSQQLCKTSGATKAAYAVNNVTLACGQNAGLAAPSTTVLSLRLSREFIDTLSDSLHKLCVNAQLQSTVEAGDPPGSSGIGPSSTGPLLLHAMEGLRMHS
eukprot:2714247-Amphidinium_carterae.2